MNAPSVIFVIGGVMSSLGKGIATASLGALLKARGFSVWLLKLDPYLNVDAGTLSPTQHGETFVTLQGKETDLDLGHYERFTGNTNSGWYSSGTLYQELISKERQGKFQGKTLQIIPHVTEAIKEKILSCPPGTDFILCEIGGTVGDIEGLSFLEAARQLKGDLGPKRCLFIHLSWIPYLKQVAELKTKLVQHSVMALQRVGIQPDIILCRSDRHLSTTIKQKIALFCNISHRHVIEALDAPMIYAVPLLYHQAGLDGVVMEYFERDSISPDLSAWNTLIHTMQSCQKKVKIGLLGKYTKGSDAYKSVEEALHHAGAHQDTSVEIYMIDAEHLNSEKQAKIMLEECDGIIIPGGFGSRASEGLIRGIHYGRKAKIPTFGICFGMQLMVIESVRYETSLQNATSSEFEDSGTPVVAMMFQWMEGNVLRTYQKSQGMGGTMRLGAQPCTLTEGSLAYRIYGTKEIIERHRHRYEINNLYLDEIQRSGLKIGGWSCHHPLIEMIERQDHPWYIGVQFHPEFASRPFAPHPLFVDFLRAAQELQQKRIGNIL
ncbi:CTP synthase [Holospora curviuscula]|uniref:CTP synthase n=1 Tax=Holospora curviuscula TaxID=1082868 RepID=A0A2S5R8N2_9PROT|nr:CTP synthase [Holospora curviuscula]PPE03686.1 CTP synthase [Holospora curviuscula]